MKELYVEPKAEVIRFVAEENLASDGNTSFIGWDVTDSSDGTINYDKGFDFY